MVETSNKSNFNNQFHSRGKNLKRNGRKNNNHQNHRQDNQSCHHQPNHKPINVKDKINEKGVCFVCKMTNHIAHDYYYKRTKEYKTNIKNKQDPRTLVNMLTNGQNSSEHSIRYNLNSPLINFTYYNKDW